MKAIFILSDTTNLRFLSMYGAADPAVTPNLERLAKRGMVFDNHWCGSAPCMPARRDIMTGRLNFLERPWGAIEPFEYTMPNLLRERNVHTMMFTDHSHYIIPGGENYLKGFTAYEVFRGQEGDPWRVRPDKSGIRPEQPPEWFKGVYSESEAANRRSFVDEGDYPSAKVLRSAAAWLEENHDADNFLLWVETFDPHEPYDAPEEYLRMYESESDYAGHDFTHPDYQPNRFDEDETRHLRNRYKALLTMTDRNLGKILDVMDAHNLWEDTMLVFTTDHGFHLGEHGLMAKNYMAPYNECFHIPMIVCRPGMAAGRSHALTQNIDMLPTFMRWFGADMGQIPYPVHGRDLTPVLEGRAENVRTETIFGYYGKQVGYTDGTYTYIRAAAAEENRPLYLYTAMPTLLRQYLGGGDAVNEENYDKIEMGRYLSWTDYPVYRFPADIIYHDNPSQEFFRRSPFNEDTMLFCLRDDYEQRHNITDETLRAAYAKKLADCMRAHESPPEQLERLGLNADA